MAEIRKVEDVPSKECSTCKNYLGCYAAATILGTENVSCLKDAFAQSQSEEEENE
jgi:hypothetical protein